MWGSSAASKFLNLLSNKEEKQETLSWWREMKDQCGVGGEKIYSIERGREADALICFLTEGQEAAAETGHAVKDN